MTHLAAPPPLTRELLEDLADRWRSAQLPVLDNLLPGLTAEQIDDIVRPLGLQLPAEAKVWWGWHDGTAQHRERASERYISPGLKFVSLREAAEVYERSRAMLAALEEGADFWWPPNQFSFMRRDGGDITVDCSTPDDPHSPVFFADTYDRQPEKDFEGPAARSLGELVTWWIEAWDQGIYGYDPESRDWKSDFERPDPSRTNFRLV